MNYVKHNPHSTHLCIYIQRDQSISLIVEDYFKGGIVTGGIVVGGNSHRGNSHRGNSRWGMVVGEKRRFTLKYIFNTYQA